MGPGKADLDPVLKTPAIRKPSVQTNLTQSKLQATFSKSTKASTNTLTLPSAVSDSPKLKEVKKPTEKAVKNPTGTGKGDGSDNQSVVSDTKKQLNDDWKARYEQTKKNLEEKENTIKQLDVKIPNMIQEFQKCITNKDNLIELRDNKLKEVSAAVESKEKTIAELTSGSRA